jgi:hypothetical protein
MLLRDMPELDGFHTQSGYQGGFSGSAWANNSNDPGSGYLIHIEIKTRRFYRRAQGF